MTTLTVRIKEDLKNKAFHQAEKLGIPLTLVVVNALENFVKSPRIVIGEPEIIEVTPAIQEKMNKIAKLLSKNKK
jgi:antitoxin component of RelBE/YafQ-DinJ toxin-antitoxin module